MRRIILAHGDRQASIQRKGYVLDCLMASTLGVLGWGRSFAVCRRLLWTAQKRSDRNALRPTGPSMCGRGGWAGWRG